ncbi:hypothetical protein FGB62_250g12 [Gracilaria domingensis]|nr:hypothetical protein FGB62_250g12 [Gracilaria domingensis]
MNDWQVRPRHHLTTAATAICAAARATPAVGRTGAYVTRAPRALIEEAVAAASPARVSPSPAATPRAVPSRKRMYVLRASRRSNGVHGAAASLRGTVPPAPDAQQLERTRRAAGSRFSPSQQLRQHHARRQTVEAAPAARALLVERLDQLRHSTFRRAVRRVRRRRVATRAAAAPSQTGERAAAARPQCASPPARTAATLAGWCSSRGAGRPSARRAAPRACPLCRRCR